MGSWAAGSGATHLSGRRRVVVRLLAVLGAAILTLYFAPVAADALGIMDLSNAGSPGDPPPSRAALQGAAHPGEALHTAGSIAVLVIAVSGLVALAIRPGTGAYATQVIASTAALFLAVLVVGNPDNYGGQAGMVDPAFLILGLPAFGAALASAPWRTWRTVGLKRPWFLAAAVTAAFPAFWYGIDQALMQRYTYPPSADPHHNGHWFAMAVVAFMLVLIPAGVAISGKGWWLGACTAGLGACLIGAASLIDRSSASALGLGWSAIAVAFGTLILGLTLASPNPAVKSTNDKPEPPGATAL